MTGCEKCTNIGYFALMTDFIRTFQGIFKFRAMGTEKTLTVLLDTVDAVFLLSSNQKMQFGYGYSQQLVLELSMIAQTFVDNLVKSLRPLALVTSAEIEKELCEQKINQFESNGFKQYPGLAYDMADAFDMHATMMQLYVNYGMPAPMTN